MDIYKFKKKGKVLNIKAKPLNYEVFGHMQYSVAKYSAEYINKNNDVLEITQDNILLNNKKIKDLLFNEGFIKKAENILIEEFKAINKYFDEFKRNHYNKMIALACELYLKANERKL